MSLGHILYCIQITSGKRETFGCHSIMLQNVLKSTVETHYNPVLGVHRSDLRYILVDGYNAVFLLFPFPPPPSRPRTACIGTYLLYKLPFLAYMLVQIKIINIFCVPILKKLKSLQKVIWFLGVPKLIIRSDKLSYCLSVTQLNIATSLIEKEPVNTQVSLFLDKLEFQWSF